MEDVIEVYHRPYDPKSPVVCIDEQPIPLIGETRTPIPGAPGRPERYDYEYTRNGTANLFLAFAPLVGWRHLDVPPRGTAKDVGAFLRYVVDEVYEEAEKVVLVTDNLNVHGTGSPYEAFDPPTARRCRGCHVQVIEGVVGTAADPEPEKRSCKWRAGQTRAGRPRAPMPGVRTHTPADAGPLRVTANRPPRRRRMARTRRAAGDRRDTAVPAVRARRPRHRAADRCSEAPDADPATGAVRFDNFGREGSDVKTRGGSLTTRLSRLEKRTAARVPAEPEPWDEAEWLAAFEEFTRGKIWRPPFVG